MISRPAGLLSIHSAVFFFGMAGLFGKFLANEPMVIVFGRTFFATAALIVALVLLKVEIRLHRWRELGGFFLMGGILAVHWVSFFHSIQLASVAIGLLTFSTFPLFVTFLEPLFFKERLRRRDILRAIGVFAGLVLVVPDLDMSNAATEGALWGILSGFTFALLALFNRRYVAVYSPLTIALYQDGIACMVLLPFAAPLLSTVTAKELLLLSLLGIVFTAIAHVLFIRGMSVVRAQLASLISCMEPVYGIVFALFLLGEKPSLKELLGGCIILGIVAATTIRSGKVSTLSTSTDN